MVQLAGAPREAIRTVNYNMAGMRPSPTVGDLADAVRARLPEAKIDFVADPDIQALVAAAHRDDGSMSTYLSGYSTERAAALGAIEFERGALAARGQPYEELDQLTIDLLLGAR